MAELKFENIDLERQQPWVDKEKQTTSHRVVQIMPNLLEWLLPYRAKAGKVQSDEYQKRYNDLRRQADLYENWLHDGLRHSFGTWHFAKFQDLRKTGTQRGTANR